LGLFLTFLGLRIIFSLFRPSGWFFSSAALNSDIVIRCYGLLELCHKCSIEKGKKEKKNKEKNTLLKAWKNMGSLFFFFFFFVAPIIITFVHYLVVAAGICIDLSQYLFIY